MNQIYGQYAGIKKIHHVDLDTGKEETISADLSTDTRKEKAVTDVENDENKEKNMDTESTTATSQEFPETAYISAIVSGYNKPKCFEDAWNHPNSEERHLWQIALKKSSSV